MARANEDTSMSSCKRTCIFPDFPTWEEAQPKNLPANFSALHVELLQSAHACFGLILSCPVRFYNNGTFSPG